MMIFLISNVLNYSFSMLVINGKHGVSGLPGEIG